MNTAARTVAEGKVRKAISLIGEARQELTIWEFEKFIRNNVRELGSSGFLCSIGQAILDGATVEIERSKSALSNSNTEHDADAQ